MWRLFAVLVVSATLTGCGHMFDTPAPAAGKGEHGYGTPEQLGPLLQRRDAETVLAERDRLIEALTAELSTAVPGSVWEPNRSEDSVHCSEFSTTNASRYFSRNWVSKVPVPAAQWDAVSQTVIDVAARYGYTDVAARGGGPSEDLEIRDGEGGVLTFGSAVNAVLKVVTGCYLTAEDKEKAVAATAEG